MSNIQSYTPINYEEVLSASMPLIDKDLSSIALIPADDIEIIEIEKKFSTIEQLKPELEAEVDKNISDCLRSYNSNYKFVAKKYLKYSSHYLTDQKKHSQPRLAKQIEAQEYETTDSAATPQYHSNQQQQHDSDYDETMSFNDQFNLLDNLNRENEALKNKQRPSSLFKFYPTQQQSDQLNAEFRMLTSAPAEHVCTKILLKCSQLKFDLEIEPMWATISLYDIKEKKKISENFCFDLNTDPIKHMLNTHLTHQDISTTAKSCLFNITFPSPDIFMVIRVEKVLQQGDISECAEPYVKTQSVSQIEKLQANAAQFCERLGKFRMPFVWTAVNIMNILNSVKTPQAENENPPPKSCSLDRRSVKSTNSKDESTHINYMENETDLDTEKDEFLSTASKPSVLKNAYENFKKSVTKTNSFRSNKEDDETQMNRFKPIAITVNTFFKQEQDKLADEDLFRFLADLKKPTNLIKKLKCVQGQLRMEFSPFEHDMHEKDLGTHYPNSFFLTPELQLIKQSNLGVEKENKQKQNHYHQPLALHNHLLPVKDILEFPGKAVYSPNYIYRNLLFVYPLSVSLANLTRASGPTGGLNSVSSISNQQTSSARNIAIKINLMKGEEDHCALPVIFAKSSSTLDYHKEVYANVIYHNKTPQYHDEIKIKLPALLNETNASYHLLFTFYHVSCQSTKDQNQLESIIGYSWLPIQQQFQFETTTNSNETASDPTDSLIPNRCTMVKNGIYSLPICFDKLPSGYSNLNFSTYSPVHSAAHTSSNDDDTAENDSSDQNDLTTTTVTNITTASNSNNSSISLSKSYFDVRLNLVSTIHTQDVYLERFIHLINQTSVDSNLLRKSLAELHLADAEALIKFLFIILDKLFHLLVQVPTMSVYGLEAISRIVHKVTNLLPNQHDGHKRNRLLIQYVKYACSLPLDFIETQCLFHEHLISELLCYLNPKQPIKYNRELIITSIWFYLEILFKSVTFYLSRATNHFKMYRCKPLAKSFNAFCTKFLSQKFLVELEALINLLINEIIDSKAKKLDESRDRLLNCALSFFINDLIALVDRGFMFRLIESYFKESHKMLCHLSNLLAEKPNNQAIVYERFKQIHSLQLDFLRIISSNEHFLALNIPFFPNLMDQLQTRPHLVIESNEFFNVHYLIGLILRQLFKSLHSAVSSIQFKAVQILRNLIESHDLDPRLESNSKARSHVAFMYMPFMNLFIHFMPLMIKKQSAQRIRQQDLFMVNCVKQKSCDFELGYLLGDVLIEPEVDLANESFGGEFDLSDELLSFDLDEDSNETGADLESDTAMNDQFIDNFLNDLNMENTDLDKNSHQSFPKNSANRKSHISDGKRTNVSKIQQPVVNKSKKELKLVNKYICCDFYNFRLNLKLDDSQKSQDACSGGAFTTETTQDLLICFLWILKNIDNEMLLKIWSRWPSIKLKKLLALIDLCISHFEFKSTIWTDLSKELKKTATQVSTSTAAIKNLINKNKFTVSKTKINDLLINKNEFIKKAKYTYDVNQQLIFDFTNDSKTLDYTNHSVLEGNLSTECSLVLLDTLELIVEIIQYQNTLPATTLKSFINKETNSLFSQHNLLRSVMKVLLNMLSIQPSIRTLPNLFCLQRDFVSKFSDLLFESDTGYCSDMCTLLLKHCTSQLNAIRSQASASMYFLMRQNFDIGNNFSRVKQQLTISLSSLVTGIGINHSEQRLTTDFNTANIAALKSSLKTILIYADSDTELIESTFPSQVKDLIINLNTILSDTIKMKEYADDSDMILDLMHRIANCYQNSPDMRLIWLQNMAQKHLEKQNLVEAGQCLVHASALIAEYLAMLENRSYLPIGCASFKNVSINVLEESAISDDVVHSTLDGVCKGKYFSETGLIGLVEQAAVFLVHSQNFEASNHLYKILIPIYEYHRDIKKLSQVHSKLHDCFNKILVNGARRLFGTYFRVGFYGDAFNELNGEEFVYKEPGITKLAEIAHRLENYYTEKFGDGVVEIMKDSNNVDKKQLDLVRKAYIQITYVEPYFDRWESQKCVTFFEKNYSLKRFIYSTPFTLEGKAHAGALNEQYKRKTILTTERAFPYVKTRIPVIDKQQIILTPVEVAIEDLQKKIDELRNAIVQEPSDPKILQMVLQGCVGTTVNQGPLEMALTFLQPASVDAITEHHNKLRLCFKEFSRRCLEALKKNKLLIGPDQYEYQREMERNYNEFRLKIDPIIENKLFKNL